MQSLLQPNLIQNYLKQLGQVATKVQCEPGHPSNFVSIEDYNGLIVEGNFDDDAQSIRASKKTDISEEKRD
jgi:hypothetical protein